MARRLVIISGCSGGGKSSLVAELARRGHATVEEPGRRVVRAQMASGGDALPWANLDGFLDAVVALAAVDLEAALSASGPVFFDRGPIDAAVAHAHLHGRAPTVSRSVAAVFERRAFLVPPWPAIHVVDAERRHGLAEATAEYERLLAAYPALGFQPVILPRLPIADRADRMLAALEESSGAGAAG